MNLKKRALWNFSASLAYQFSTLLLGLILPKYYTEVFGSVYNGLNQTVSQVLSLLSVLQFGIAAVSIQQMFQYIAQNDEPSIAAIYWNTGKQYRKMGWVFLAVSVPILALFPLLIQDDLPKIIIVLFLLFRMIASAGEYFFQAKYTIILTAYNKSYVISAFNTVMLLFSTVLHFSVLFTVKNIILYQSVALVATLVRLVVVYAYIRKNFGFLYRNKNAATVADHKTKRKDALISEIAGMVIDSTDLLVLSTLSGLVNASIYSIYSFVTTGIGNVLSSCREAVFAGLGKTFFADFDEFRRKFERFESVYFLLTFYLYTTALLLFKSFILVYTKKMDATYYYVGLPILFVLARLLVNLRIPAIVTINTAGHFSEVKKYAVIEAIINLCISLALVKPLGIYGVLIGTISGALYRTPLLVRHSDKHILKRKDGRYLKKVGVWLPLPLIAYGISETVDMPVDTLAGWLLLAVAAAVGVLLLFILWSFVADRSTLKECIGIVKMLLHRKKRTENQ